MADITVKAMLRLEAWILLYSSRCGVIAKVHRDAALPGSRPSASVLMRCGRLEFRASTA